MMKRALHSGLSITFLILLIGFFSCQSGTKRHTNLADSIDVTEVDEKLISEIKTAKLVFYSLPSPLETAMILKKAGATFNPDILNPLSKVSTYITTKSMALNLGIYSTDLSYASLFEQTQYSLQYMAATQKLVEGLGITDAITNETMQRLKENLNRRDVLMDIISEAFMNSSSFLKDNNRSAISALVLIGGWIEGLYLATKLVEKDGFEKSELVQRIIDQKLSLDNVYKLLEENKNEADIASVLVLIDELKSTYEKVSIKSSVVKTEQNENDNVTTLKSKTEYKIDEEAFKQLCNQVKAIRNNFTL